MYKTHSKINIVYGIAVSLNTSRKTQNMFNVQKFTFPAVTFYGTFPVVKGVTSRFAPRPVRP